MKLQYYVYFLNKIKQKPLLEDKRNKNDIFLSVLENTGKPIYYKEGRAEYAFVIVYKKDEYVKAGFGKKTFLKKHLSPEKKFEEFIEEDWPHCNVFLNLSDDSEKGQRIAFEYNSSIFPEPYSQLKSFADELNSRLLTYGYVISINPVIEEYNFWKIVKDNKNNIERLTFIFNAPNLFNLDNKLENDLKSAEKKYGMSTAKIEFENPYGGLKIPKDQLMKQGAEYIAKGGGEYKIKMKKGVKIVTSRKNIKTIEFKDLEIDIKKEEGGQETILSILKEIFR